MSEKTIVQIIDCENLDEIICHYPRQSEPQGVYIELDCKTGQMHASYNSEIGNAIPFSVYHGHDRRWSIAMMQVDTINALMRKIEPLAQRILDGYTSEWDGNNNVARFTEDAKDAIDEIGRILDDCDSDVEYWNDACEYFDAVTRYHRDDDGTLVKIEINGSDAITVNTTHEELDKIRASIDAEIPKGVRVNAVDGYLKQLLGELQEG